MPINTGVMTIGDVDIAMNKKGVKIRNTSHNAVAHLVTDYSFRYRLLSVSSFSAFRPTIGTDAMDL